MENNKPEKHFRFGPVRASIWRDTRQTADGKQFETASVSLDRAYKDSRGSWQNTHSLRENDIPKAILALNKAFEFITEKEDDGIDVERIQ